MTWRSPGESIHQTCQIYKYWTKPSLLPAWRLTSKLCLSTRGIFLDPLYRSLPCSCDSIRFKTRCWPAPVSSLIQVNRESLGTSRASTANRKHCLVNNTNGGHCHSQLVIVNHLGCKCNSLISWPHLLRLSRGGVMSRHALKWVSTLTLVANEVWRRGNRHLHCVKHNPEASYRLYGASRFDVRLQLATCDLALHVPRSGSTSAGQLLQLITSSVHGSLMKLISVLVRTITPTGR